MEHKKDIYHEKALELVLSGKSLFITGKAGTGKSYLIRNIVDRCKEIGKNVVVTAPTGIAAMNANGATLHSLLRLPLSPYIPGIKIPRLYSLTDSAQEVIKCLDIMIIDEISMVRCDMLDMIDDVLRHYRDDNSPFGGIQMVLVGDLYQLMPVVTDEDWEKLKKKYETQYFFGSQVYKKVKLPIFELKTIHRQEDNNFRILLNNIREGAVSSYEVLELQKRYTEDTKITNDCDFLRLTTHNFLAKIYNFKRLDALPGEAHTYTAIRIGYFPKEDNPTDYNLKLKVGARVMFIKNDNESRTYVNGTLGTIVRLFPEVMVLTDDSKRVIAKPVKWDLYKYTINKQSQQLETDLLGSFIQLPLIHAWAVTIHKSQGLTFDKVVIDAGNAFTYGQVYVALSRCRNFHNLYLVSKITSKIIKTDPVVVDFMNNAKTIRVKGEKKDKKVNQREHLGLGEAVDKTLWMVEDGLDFDQIVKQSSVIPEIIYSHLAKLIELGKIGIERFIMKQTYKEIHTACMNLGKKATIHDIRNACESNPKFGEISLVLASIKSKRKVDFSTVITEYLEKKRHHQQLDKLKEELREERLRQKEKITIDCKEKKSDASSQVTNHADSLFPEQKVDLYKSSQTPWIIPGKCRFVVAKGGVFLFTTNGYYQIPSELNSPKTVTGIFYGKTDQNGFRQLRLIILMKTVLVAGIFKQDDKGFIEFYDSNKRYYKFKI